MSDYDVDFTEVNNTRYLAPGHYRLRLKSVTEKDGRQAPQFIWVFDCAEGQSQTNTSLATAALWKLQEVLTALGVDASGKLRISGTSLGRLVGRYVDAEVIAESADDGKTYSRISKLSRPADVDAEPLPSQDYADVDFDSSPF